MENREIDFTITAQTDFGEMDFYCTPENTELYLHSNNYSSIDHIFNRYNNLDRTLGVFVWREVLGNEEFIRISDFIHNTGAYEIHYKPTPSEADLQQYGQYIVKMFIDETFDKE